MKFYLVLILVLSLPIFSFGQNDDELRVTDLILDDFCKCFESIEYTNNNDFKVSLGECLTNVKIAENEEIIQYVKENLLKQNSEVLSNEENYQIGYEWVQSLLLDNLQRLTLECDDYYFSMLKIRKYSNMTDKTVESEKEIINLTAKIEKYTLKSLLLNQRGYHYINIGDFEKAIEDFLKSRDENPDDISNLYFLAMAYEYSMDFEKAIDYYQKFYDETGNFYAIGSVEVLKRLISEKKY